MARVSTYGMRKITRTITAAGTQLPISSTTLFTTDFELYVSSANVGAAMYIGDSTVDNSWIPRLKGSTTNFVAGNGRLLGGDQDIAFDLSKIYLDGAANGDVAIIQYYAQDNPS